MNREQEFNKQYKEILQINKKLEDEIEDLKRWIEELRRELE